ncbi:hypothetical protein ONT15_13925 [Prevotella copri]|uniref:Major fimbrial subunit protein N-terminal domain-containing protein n=1 Tax=Segatella copri TaxID=165179 RepID=A0AAW5UBR0_9BACT|nr:fimbrial protein [Segatella copri]MCW4100472.1 hypothetical protein [Segatella copri]MCW4132972.1 hypothetical protein [Segatella copri]MCW4163527.1 hypothetical protein [Segatella copri]
MKIRDFILSLVSWFILLVTVSCSDELGGERAPISSESNLHVLVPTVLSSRGTRTDDASGLPTYNATVDECQINDLTLYAFPVNNDGKLLVETLPAPLATMMVEQHVANYQLTIEPGTYHIYVVANMNKVLSGKTIKTEDELKNIVLYYRPTSTPGMPVCTNIPMIYEPKDVNGTIIDTKIEKSGKKYTEVAANLKFTCVKVKLNLIMDPTASDNLYDKSYSITDIAAQKLTPSTHLLWDGKFTQTNVSSEYATGIENTIYRSSSTGEASTGRYYQNGEYTIDETNANENNKDVVSITDRTNKGTPIPTNFKQWLFQGTYYLPERYISKVEEQSVLKINGIVNSSNKNQYTIKLGHKQNASDALPTFPRGTYYEIIGKIKSLGNMTLDCNVSVKDWTPVTIDADFNHTTLWVSKTKASVTSTTTDSIDYESNVMLTDADFGCDEKVTTSSGVKDVIVLDAVKNHRITFKINEDIKFSDYNRKYKGTAKVWIKAGNIKKYLDVEYDASPYFEVNPQEVTIYWGSDNNTKLVQFKTNLGGLAFTDNGTSSTVGKSTIQASCDKTDTPEGTFKIVATSNPVTTTVHYLTVQPKESPEGFNFVKKIKVTVKPAVGNYRINFRAINDRAHYKGDNSNGTDNYKGTPEEKKEETYNGTPGNTNWADGWLDLSDDNDKRIYIPQTDNHRVYVYTQIGETTGAVASSKVWKFSVEWPGDKMVEDNTNVGWYYKDFSKDAQSISTDFGATGTRTIKPGETLIMFSNNTNTNWGFTLHRCPHHLEPGIPLFDYEDKEGWIVYDPTSDPTWNIYDDMPTIENINFTIYTKFQTYGWFNVYGAANGKNGNNDNTERESFTIYDTAGKSWSCENLNNGWYKTVITLKAVKGDHGKAIRIKKDNKATGGESVLLFNGNSYEKHSDTGWYDGSSWHAGKPF